MKPPNFFQLCYLLFLSCAIVLLTVGSVIQNSDAVSLGYFLSLVLGVVALFRVLIYG